MAPRSGCPLFLSPPSTLLYLYGFSTAAKKSIIDQIIDAAFVGNLRRIKKLAREMDKGKGMSETLGSIKESAGRTVLHTAAMMGKINVCKYWLEELKLPVDERDDDYTCNDLFWSRKSGFALLPSPAFSFYFKKADIVSYCYLPNISINLLPSPLMWALLKKSLPCTKLLIQERIRERERILEEKSNGDDALKRKEYMEAMMHYTKGTPMPMQQHFQTGAFAWHVYPDLALSDAEVCIKLRPDWSEGYCRAGVALYLLEKFNMAADVLLLGLKLDPHNKELKDAFRSSLFLHYFHGSMDSNVRKVVEAKMNSVHI
ncbi:hypothetical protein IFM89_005119 [Coptis chinensis]|uniref:Uncharacterized protein n=1 Tax=Coptis chinensis TaxID=261450 RepID=A0A835M4Q6_9MAGN|nr:hypothetical protein IFM89_005119 [Coptis chinensis]